MRSQIRTITIPMVKILGVPILPRKAEKCSTVSMTAKEKMKIIYKIIIPKNSKETKNGCPEAPSLQGGEFHLLCEEHVENLFESVLRLLYHAGSYQNA
jgi:hypothetical protein